MDYELETARISRRSALPSLLAAAITVGLLAVAIAVGMLEPRGDGSTGAGAGARGEPSPTPSGAPAQSSAPAELRPEIVRCHHLAAGPCRRIATVALEAIGPVADPVEWIDVWSSLLCADDLDCPRGRLAGLRPLGSAVVTLGGGGPTGWVNVGERLPGALVDGPGLVAWVIR
jgi:hypothetical protein